MRSLPVYLGLGSALCMCLVLSADAQRAKPRTKAPARKAATPVKKAAAPAANAASAAVYQREILPLMKKYCSQCHGPNVQIQGIDYSKYPDEASVVKGRSVWEHSGERIAGGTMPPKNAPQPTKEEREKIVSWIEAKLKAVDCGVRDPGRVTMRRLNRAEYNNTVRDLIGLDLRLADEFPSDDVGYGFDNIGDVLSISPILMEKYLSAAERISERAIVTPDPKKERFEGERMPDETKGDGAIANTARNLTSTGEVFVEYPFPVDGEYVLRARAWGQQAGPSPCKMSFRLDGQELELIDVPAVEKEPGVYEVRAQVKGGKRKFAVAFTNDYYMPKEPNPRDRDRNLLVDWIEVEGPFGEKLGDPPAIHKRILFEQPTETTRLGTAKKILARFASRAFRRPATAEEVERLTGIVRQALKEGDSFERGIQLAVQATLVSPHFLFRVELDPDPNNATATRALNDYELANRLSYFLWSSMPDDELFDLAAKGLLKKPEVLEKQALRMLKDPRAEAMVENFGMQWLTLRNLQNVNPDPKKYPAFNAELRDAMYQETKLFFTEILQKDRSILDLLDGKFTYVNEALAKHYSIPGVTGQQFRRVELPGEQRLGVLTQGSILTITSNPTRTSPVKRGKWVMEQVLGTPPPPALPDVPPLADDQEGQMLTGTLRQRMEQHRKDPACASCHTQMDAIGFGLENFDAVGAWRSKDGTDPVDASGTLPNGASFNGPAELIAILKKGKEPFVKNFTSQMLTFALGRGLENFDRCEVDKIITVLPKKDYRVSALVTEIVKSEPFRLRRGDSTGQ